MARKVIVLADPGIDTALALAVALHDPQLDVLAILATAGNVDALQATQNCHLVIDQIDPPKWPRLGAGLHVDYDYHGRLLNGQDGLGNANFPGVSLHSPTPADKLLTKLVQAEPDEITLVCLGPLTTVAAVFERHPELAKQLDRVLIAGGTWREMGNARITTELRFACDPIATRAVLQSGANIIVLPLDASRKVILSPKDFRELPNPDGATGQFLKKIVPYGIRASSHLYGLEGLYLSDLLAVYAVGHARDLAMKSAHVDVETRGELTRGMMVVDPRPKPAHAPNAQIVTGVDVEAVHNYMMTVLAG